MTVSQTFGPEPSRGGVTVSYAPYLLASSAHTVHLLRAHAFTLTATQAQLDLQLPNCILTWFGPQHAKEYAARGGGNHGDQHRVVNTCCHSLRNEKK